MSTGDDHFYIYLVINWGEDPTGWKASHMLSDYTGP